MTDIEKFMELIDDVKEKMPENTYINICGELKKMHDHKYRDRNRWPGTRTYRVEFKIYRTKFGCFGRKKIPVSTELRDLNITYDDYIYARDGNFKEIKEDTERVIMSLWRKE